MKFLATLLLITAATASAQEQKTRPALEADFVGYWRIILIANEVHNSPLKNEKMGYSDPCQFFVHKPGGVWHNISITNVAGPDESKRQCPTQRSLVDVSLSAQPTSPFKWTKVPSQNGLFFIMDTSVTDPKAVSSLLWKADYVLEDIPAIPSIGFALKKGDLIMQLTRRLEGNRIAPVWPMILRAVQE